MVRRGTSGGWTSNTAVKYSTHALQQRGLATSGNKKTLNDRVKAAFPLDSEFPTFADTKRIVDGMGSGDNAGATGADSATGREEDEEDEERQQSAVTTPAKSPPLNPFDIKPPEVTEGALPQSLMSAVGAPLDTPSTPIQAPDSSSTLFGAGLGHPSPFATVSPLIQDLTFVSLLGTAQPVIEPQRKQEPTPDKSAPVGSGVSTAPPAKQPHPDTKGEVNAEEKQAQPLADEPSGTDASKPLTAVKLDAQTIQGAPVPPIVAGPSDSTKAVPTQKPTDGQGKRFLENIMNSMYLEISDSDDGDAASNLEHESKDQQDPIDPSAAAATIPRQTQQHETAISSTSTSGISSQQQLQWAAERAGLEKARDVAGQKYWSVRKSFIGGLTNSKNLATDVRLFNEFATPYKTYLNATSKLSKFNEHHPTMPEGASASRKSNFGKLQGPKSGIAIAGMNFPRPVSNKNPQSLQHGKKTESSKTAGVMDLTREDDKKLPVPSKEPSASMKKEFRSGEDEKVLTQEEPPSTKDKSAPAKEESAAAKSESVLTNVEPPAPLDLGKLCFSDELKSTVMKARISTCREGYFVRKYVGEGNSGQTLAWLRIWARDLDQKKATLEAQKLEKQEVIEDDPDSAWLEADELEDIEQKLQAMMPLRKDIAAACKNVEATLKTKKS